MKQIFPKWINKIIPIIIGIKIITILSIIVFFYFYGSDSHLSVGYKPTQPIAYSHALHVGKLNLDCRYCHYTVEKSAKASVPPTATCLNCHNKVKLNSPKLIPLHKVSKEFLEIEKNNKKIEIPNPNYNKPIEWRKVHKLPDHVTFNHSVHVKSANISCVSCHGRVDQMEVVKQVKPLTMRWCLDCHNNPEKHLRPTNISPTNLAWPKTKEEKATQEKFSTKLKANRIRWEKAIKLLHNEQNSHKKQALRTKVKNLEKKHFFKPPRECSACHY